MRSALENVGFTNQNNETSNGNNPVVTTSDIDKYIESEVFFSGLDGVDGAEMMRHFNEDKQAKLDRVTMCVIILKNGKISVGINSCAEEWRFNREVSRSLARNHAIANAVKMVNNTFNYQFRSFAQGAH